MLFRLNAGRSIKLRERSVKRTRSFDVLTEGGLVQPRALDPSTYSAPNGASMRPVGKNQEGLVETFKGSNVVVYAIPEGTPLPSDLILVHEHTDHYSLQAAKNDAKIDDFIRKYSQVYTRDQWLATFKRSQAHSYSAASTSAASQAYQAQPSQSEWTWSTEYQRRYRIDRNGNIIWEDAAASSSSSSSAAHQGQTNNHKWQWSAKHKRHYRYDSAGNVEWR
ncbi:hypothetical protein F5Y03DRAFT_393950 [Xylaria venustula]|nr:hypothetical protein F5Y03DRAFT_393950 [Xylaria venustula]